MQKRVFLFGNSIVAAGIFARLKDFPALEILPLDPAAPDPNLNPNGSTPEPRIVLVDLADPQAASSLPKLYTTPNTKVIGVDAEHGTFTVITGEAHPAQSLAEFISWLNQEVQTEKTQPPKK
jgi:hypothetical protein